MKTTNKKRRRKCVSAKVGVTWTKVVVCETFLTAIFWSPADQIGNWRSEKNVGNDERRNIFISECYGPTFNESSARETNATNADSFFFFSSNWSLVNKASAEKVMNFKLGELMRRNQRRVNSTANGDGAGDEKRKMKQSTRSDSHSHKLRCDSFIHPRATTNDRHAARDMGFSLMFNTDL